MELKIEVASEADGKEYGGTQVMQVSVGEFVLDEIFKLNFFRIIIDDVIDGALCFRLMEGAAPHYFVLEGRGDSATFERETPVGSDFFRFTLL